MSEATQLIPNWTYDDFLSDRPYEWLYSQKDNKFLLQQLLNRMQVVAKELKFPGGYIASADAREACNQYRNL